MKVKPEAILALLLVAFFLVELKGLSHYDNVDENIYFYMGKLITEGKTPYSDFFFAHPPLKIYVNAFVIKLFGLNFFILKLIPLLSVIISAIFVFRIMKEHFGNAEGLCSAALFLSSFTVMSESTYATGINVTLMLAIIGLYYSLAKRYFLGGLFAGFSGIAGLYSLIFVPVAAFFVFLSSRKGLLRYLAGFSLVFVSVNLFFLIISGNYFVSVYKYHLLKPEVEGNTLTVFWNVVIKSPVLFALAAIFVFYRSRKLLPIAAIAALYILFLLLLSRIFSFYFMLLIPLLAMLASYALLRLADSKMRPAVLAAVFFLVMASVFLSARYLYAFDFVDFQSARPMADFIAQNSPPEGTIFGDDTSTPLIALFSGRKVWHDMVDTNYMVFGSGVVNLEGTINELRADPPAYVIVRPAYNIAAFSEFRQYLEGCEILQSYRDPQWGDFMVYQCSQS